MTRAWLGWAGGGVAAALAARSSGSSRTSLLPAKLPASTNRTSVVARRALRRLRRALLTELHDVSWTRRSRQGLTPLSSCAAATTPGRKLRTMELLDRPLDELCAVARK